MKLKWNFPGGEGVQNKTPSIGGGVWIFSGIAPYMYIICDCSSDLVFGFGSALHEVLSQ